MEIGAFADVIFEVSRVKVMTFDEFKRDTKARYARHELINRTTALEYLGRDLEEISFKMIFNERLGVNPSREAARVRELCLEGEADYLIIGNRVFGNHLWVIETVTETAAYWDDVGNILVSALDVKLIEYVPEMNHADY